MKKKPLVSHPEKSANDWLADIMKASGPTGQVDEVPEGWMTHRQMCDQAGLCDTTMNNRLIKLIAAGKLQRRKYRALTGRNVSEVWHYFKA